MNCSPFDLSDYFFGELSPADRSATEAHITACVACREELAKFSEVRSVLLSASPDEEPPRRIAFVSDKVFEPRWWQRLWSSASQLGFAASAMLAVAILVHGVLTRPATASIAVAQKAPVAAVPTAPSEADVERRVQTEVARILGEHEGKQTEKILEVVNAKLRSAQNRNNENLILIREYLERMNKRNASTVRNTVYE